MVDVLTGALRYRTTSDLLVGAVAVPGRALAAWGWTAVWVLGPDGERWDADLGMYELRARRYDPSAGRFGMADPLRGTELWVSDLTAEGTRLAADINTALQGFASSSPSVFAALDVGRAVFSADDGVHGREAWASDGTPEGTRLIADIFAGAPASEAGGSPFGGPSGPPFGPIGFAPVSPPPDWAM